MPVSLPPDSSARYSLFLETPSWMRAAAIGSVMSARRAIARDAPLRSSLNNADHTAILVT